MNTMNTMNTNLTFTSFILVLVLASCASKPKQDNEMLEKYPQCYHANPKLSKKCFEKNEGGVKTTAVELENTAFPGQYN